MILTLTGFSNSGKTTVFNVLTGLALETTLYPTPVSSETEPHKGVVRIPDERVDRLSSIYHPKKTTFATIEYVDFPGIISATAGGDVSHNARVFSLIRESDAIVHVVRAFEDNAVVHSLQTVHPSRDVSAFEDELIFGDLELVEKRLVKIEEQEKKGKKRDEGDRRLLLKCKKALEDEISLRDVAFSEEELGLMQTYQFLTTIPEIIVLNIHENEINAERIELLRNDIAAYFKRRGKGVVPSIIVLCGKMEMEIAQLGDEEAQAFLDDLGIEEPAMRKLCSLSYQVLGLISFFTVGKDEVKAWTVRNGIVAHKAAGKIHSDIERGFIRAEVVGFEDYRGSDFEMAKARERGLVRLEGKTYHIQDGDIINFKFNV